MRSGAAVSMPGMMETVLNVGLNATTLSGLRRLTGKPAPCARLPTPPHRAIRRGRPCCRPAPVRGDHRRRIAGAPTLPPSTSSTRNRSAASLPGMRTAYAEEVGKPFPDDPMLQLMTTIEAVLQSWSSDPRQVL
ncbi:MAG: hypothetical protein WDN31_06345 [Hyphomicrobium sp.]